MSGQRKIMGISTKQQQNEPQIQQMLKQKQQQLNQKIEREIQKQKHILKIQHELQEKLRRKNQQIIRKLNKSVQAKKSKVQKIKQKCTLRIKYQMQKSDAFKKKQKAQLHRSWRQSLKLSEWINNRTSQHKRRIASQIRQQDPEERQNNDQIDQVLQMKDVKSKPQNNKFLPLLSVQAHKKQPISLTKSIQRTTHNYYTNNQAYQTHKSSKGKAGDHTIYSHQDKQVTYNSIDYVQKLKQKSKQKENEQIKKFNEKLERLEEARMKKQKLQKQKQKKIHDLLQFKSQKLKQIKRMQKQKANNNNKTKTQHKRTKTLGSQQQQNNLNNSSVSGSKSNKNILFKKWEQDNKVRQAQLFQSRIRKGQDYMQSMKDKTNKNKMSRQIQVHSIQKKLFLQRKRMYELMKIASKNNFE